MDYKFRLTKVPEEFGKKTIDLDDNLPVEEWIPILKKIYDINPILNLTLKIKGKAINPKSSLFNNLAKITLNNIAKNCAAILAIVK